MDYGAWRSSKRCHRNFREEERQDYRGKVRKAKIFVDAEEEEEVFDPTDNVFNVTIEEEKKTDLEAVAWLNKDAVNGLMEHSLTMMGGKAGVKKEKKLDSGMSNEGEVVFDPFNPQENMKVDGGPIPYSKHHKLKRRVVKVEETGVAIEESMANWAQEDESKNDDGIDPNMYGDGVERPKKVKELSDKRKRAALLKGNSNPAAQMREQLAYKAAMDKYRKQKGIDADETVDHSALATYGSVDVRRKKGGEGEAVVAMDEDDLAKLQEEIDAKKEEQLREIAEKELIQKEKQLVARRVGDMEGDSRKGLLRRIIGLGKQQIRFFRGQFTEPTKVKNGTIDDCVTLRYVTLRYVTLRYVYVCACLLEGCSYFEIVFLLSLT